METLPPPLDGLTAAVLSVPTEAPTPHRGGLPRTLIQTPEVRVIAIGLGPDEALPEHHSQRRALIQVAAGRCDFAIAGRWQIVGTGDLIHLPPGQRHAVRASYGACTLLLALIEPTANRLPVSR